VPLGAWQAVVVPDEGWEMKNSPYTPEGSVESASRFGRPGRGRRRRNQLRRFGLLLLIAPVALFAIAALVGLLAK
jgi:hypothetical protein